MMKQRRGDLGRAHEFVAHDTFNDGDHIVDRGVHPHIAVNAGGRARQHLAFDLAYAHRDNRRRRSDCRKASTTAEISSWTETSNATSAGVDRSDCTASS